MPVDIGPITIHIDSLNNLRETCCEIGIHDHTYRINPRDNDYGEYSNMYYCNMCDCDCPDTRLIRVQYFCVGYCCDANYYVCSKRCLYKTINKATKIAKVDHKYVKYKPYFKEMRELISNSSKM